jgi:eukaryotic-like serine/threonine-protein kinase
VSEERPSAVRAGSRLGRYEIVGAIGAGGMGEVFRARDERLQRSVAIKVLPASLQSDADRVKRFEREALAASALNHPNIVTIYEVAQSDDVSYIVMELVEGRTLREVIGGQPMAVKRLLPIAAQVADGLAKAHASGIVHRDLKPENVMVSKDGFVKILDFGLAKLTLPGGQNDSGPEGPTVTRGTEPGLLMGTVGFMSPEQASGRPLDFRSDQFSLGSILYEMATGRRAFGRGTSVQTLTAIIEDEPQPISSVAPKVPPSLVWLIERCLAKDPEDRYAATKDLARDLAGLRDRISDMSGAEAGESLSGRPTRATRFWRRAVIAGAAIGLGAALFFVGQMRGARLARLTLPPQYSALTFRKGYVTGARFAPDGQTVVYSAKWQGRASEIFELRLASPEARPLGIFPAGILAVSSTGEMAVSLGCENVWDPCYGTLARVPLGGGAPREILEGVLSADWSPDGQNLAVTRRVDTEFLLEYPLGKVLYRTTGWLGSVRVAPDGVTLAFTEHPSLDGVGGRVCLLDPTGKKRELTGDVGLLGGLAWRDGGREILFDGVTKDYGGLCAVTPAGSIRGLYSPCGRVLDISKEGRLLVDQGEARAEIMALSPGSSRERDLSWLSLSVAADLSADGRNLLFDDGGGVYYRTTEGSDAKRLGDGKALALSPDQRWAIARRKGGEAQLTLLPTGLGQPKVLDTGAAIYYGALWLPDSRHIVFASQDKAGVRRSFAQDTDGSPPRQILADGFLATLVSPDGKRIAATRIEGGAYLCAVDAKTCEPIASVLPDDDLVQWSEDGKTIFVRGADKEVLPLYRVDLKTGRREHWKTLSPPDSASFEEFGSGPRGIRLTPDGRAYAYTWWTRLTNLGLVENLP